MTVVSMCHISLARVVRSPIFGFTGCTRIRGRRRARPILQESAPKAAESGGLAVEG